MEALQEGVQIKEEEIKEVLLKVNESNGFIIKNIKNRYEWIKPWYNSSIYVMEGWSLIDLLRDKQIPFFSQYIVIEICEDCITVRIPKHGKYQLIVYTEDNIKKDFIKIIPIILTVSS